MNSYKCGDFEVANITQRNIEKVISQMPVNSFTIAINAEKIIQINENENFRKLVSESYVNFVDGVMAISLVKKFNKDVHLQKIDMPSNVISFALKSKKTIALIGGHIEIVTAAAKRLESMGLVVSEFSHGYVSDEELIKTLRYINADYTLLALGSPRQEYIASEATKIGCRTRIIPCGGAIDIIGGAKKRAPIWVQHFRCEFLYRLLTDPSRFKRYMKILRVFKYV